MSKNIVLVWRSCNWKIIFNIHVCCTDKIKAPFGTT